MILKVVWDSDCSNFGKQLEESVKDYNVEISLYDMSSKQKKSGYKVMNVCGARKCPFVSVYNPDLVKAFYTEDNSCIIDNIIKYLENE